MPRLIKYTTDGIVDNIPDESLAVIEHVSLFYLIDRQFKNTFQKFVAFALAGSAYEFLINDLKRQDVNKQGSASTSYR